MAEDFAFREAVRSYWINFVKTGNPNGPGLPESDEFNSDNGEDSTLIFGVKVEMQRDLKREMAEYLEN